MTLRLGETDRSTRSYAVYVLEASTSNRLTYFLPPLVRASIFAKPHTLIVLRMRISLH